ncbi:MAG: hypothetical protein KDC87_11810, partial [Planctomycetes bacterium]|nr:hypothetical protein [Planctomycetota bacterium]
ERRSTVTSERDQLALTAAEGLTVLRSSQQALRDSLVVQGHGAIEVLAEGLHATGNRGFTALQGRAHADPAATATPGPVVRFIRLGPLAQDGSHRYRVLRNDTATRGRGSPRAVRNRDRGNRDLELTGSGSCTIRLRERVVEQLLLASPLQDIKVVMHGTANRLEELGSVVAVYDPEHGTGSWTGKGSRVHATFETRRGTVHGFAEEIHQPTADTLRLVGERAEVRHPDYGVLRGREIRLRRFGAAARSLDEDVELSAWQDAKLLVDHTDADSGERTKSILQADELHIEPFAVPPGVARVHQGWMPTGLDLWLDGRYLLARGNVLLDIEHHRGTEVTHGHGTGNRLVLRTDRAGRAFADGFLSGEPARFRSRGARGQPMAAAATTIRCFLRAEQQYLVLVDSPRFQPQLILDGSLGGHQSDVRTVMTCAGDIEVLPRRIAYHGPVQVRTVDHNGGEQRDGTRFDAAQLEMRRGPDGQVNYIACRDRVRFRWGEVHGTCDELVLDAQHTRLMARGVDKPAVIQLPDRQITVRQVNYNYRTRMAQCWQGSAKDLLTAR